MDLMMKTFCKENVYIIHIQTYNVKLVVICKMLD